MKTKTAILAACISLAFFPSLSGLEAATVFPVEGTVAETMNVDHYTYLRIQTAEGDCWVATSPAHVGIGSSVRVPDGVVMSNFTSPALGKTFDSIVFAERLEHEGAASGAPSLPSAALPAGHPPVEASSQAVCPASKEQQAASGTSDKAMEVIPPPEGGLSIADVHARRAELSGKEVKVRGKVVKFSPSIMGKNWAHLQDGSAPGQDGDLTVTSQAIFRKGEMVTITGTLTLDVDLGAHYIYPVLVENAVRAED